MADIIHITKAKTYGKALKIVFGIEPDYDIQADTIRIYYPPDKLYKVQQRFDAMTKKKSDTNIEWLPIITPHLLKNYAPFLLLSLVLAYVAGKIK